MYGHITPDGTVGQLFENKPSAGLYHPSFLEAVRLLPDGASTGWRYDGARFLTPAPPDQPAKGSFADLWQSLCALIPDQEGI